MTQVVEVPLESGGTLLVETADEGDGGERGVERAGRGDRIVDEATTTLESALDRVRPAAEILLEKLRSLVQSPSEIEVKFGIKITAQAGAIIAKAGGEANFEVTLLWKRPQ